MAGFGSADRVMHNRTFSGAGLKINCVDYGGEGGRRCFYPWRFRVRPLVGLRGPVFTDKFHTLAMDLRGHGESEWSAQGNYALADYAADVTAMAAGWGLGEPVIVGHSRGGLVAISHAADHPGRRSAPWP